METRFDSRRDQSVVKNASTVKHPKSGCDPADCQLMLVTAPIRLTLTALVAVYAAIGGGPASARGAAVHSPTSVASSRAARPTQVVGWAQIHKSATPKNLQSITVSGPPHRQVRIQKQVSGAWRTTQVLRTGSRGGIDLRHLANQPGTWRILIPPTDGWRRKTTSAIRIRNSPAAQATPSTDFTVETYGLTVAVAASPSLGLDPGVPTFTWNWGDGTTQSGGKWAVHRFEKPGSYSIALETTAPHGGGVSRARHTINALPLPSLARTYIPSGYTDEDVAQAIDRARRTGGGTVALGSGNYVFDSSVSLNSSHLTISGSEDGRTTIKVKGDLDAAFTSTSPSGQEGITLKDFTVDMSQATGSYAQAIQFGAQTRSAVVDNITFTGASKNQRVVEIDSASGISLTNCTFWGDGTNQANAVYVAGGSANVAVLGSRFHYFSRGVYVAGAARNLTIWGNRFDGGWYTGVPTATGIAQFTSSSEKLSAGAFMLNDPSADFLTDDVRLGVGTTIRLLVPRATGSAFASVNGTHIAASIRGARTGDWIRTSSGRFAVVDDVDTRGVTVEEWLSDANRMPTSQPRSEDDWTLYRTVVGQVWGGDSEGSSYPEGSEPRDPDAWGFCAASKTRICADPAIGWRDMDGTRLQPKSGTRYELSPRGEYQVFISGGTDGIRLIGNDLRRTWADSIGSGSDRPTIRRGLFAGNTIRSGQDMGITLMGFSGALVEGNIILDPGSSGIAIWDSVDCAVIDNTVEGGGWQGKGSVGVSLERTRTTVRRTEIRRLHWDPTTSRAAQSGSAVRASGDVHDTHIANSTLPAEFVGATLAGKGVRNTRIDEPRSFRVIRIGGAT